MIKTLELILACSFVASTSLADVVYSNQNIGETNITSTNGTTIISGPNGIVILNNNADAFGGSWHTGMNVTLSRVLSGEHLPSKINISSFEIKMNDGEEMLVLALRGDEQHATAAEKSKLVWGRAAKICQLTKTHPHPLKVETKSKWFKGMLIDLNERGTKNNSYNTYKADSNFSGTRYFSELTCGILPRGY